MRTGLIFEKTGSQEAGHFVGRNEMTLFVDQDRAVGIAIDRPRSHPPADTARSTSTRFSCLRGLASWLGKLRSRLERAEQLEVDVEPFEDREVNGPHPVRPRRLQAEPRLEDRHLGENVVAIFFEYRAQFLTGQGRQIGWGVGCQHQPPAWRFRFRTKPEWRPSATS